MDYKDFGTKVRQLRREKGLTQEALAEKLDISASFMGHIERGTRVASLETLVTLCNVLEVSPQYLLNSGLTIKFPCLPDSLTESQRSNVLEVLRIAEQAAHDWYK